MIRHPRQPLDPLLGQLLAAAPMTFDLERDGVEAARAGLRRVLSAAPDANPDIEIADHSFVTAAGNPLALRVYRPSSTHGTGRDTLPLVLYCHGGGFALGDLDSYDSLCKRHAAGALAIVVAVEYRLAPEHPYPAAVDDVWAALQWVADHATELDGDASLIAVAGDSAGGNLAAVVAQLARNSGGPDVRFQLLWYPTTTCDSTLPSVIENAEAPILDLASIRTLMMWYAGHIDLSDAPPTLAPARAPTLAGLPPAFIGIAGHDPLRDDGGIYAERLAAADVPVQLHHAPTLIHGYAYFAGIVPAATEAVDAGIRALGAALLR